jgi:hypothetical protein
VPAAGRNGFRFAILGQDLYKFLFADYLGAALHKRAESALVELA